MGPAALPIALVAGSLAGQFISSNAAKRAGDRTQKATDEQIEFQRRQAAEEQQRLQSFSELGERAAGTIGGTLAPFRDIPEGDRLTGGVDFSKFGLPSFKNDEGFKFQQEQGERAINRYNAARGFALSGSAAEALLDFNRQLSGEEVERERGRQFALLNLGQNSALGQANLGQNSLNTQAGLTSTNTQTQASLDLARGRANTEGTQGVLLGLGLAARELPTSQTPIFDEFEEERRRLDQAAGLSS